MSGTLRSEQKPVRVLHVVGNMVRGGSENWIMSLLRKADRRVLRMDICCAKSEKAAHDEEVRALGSRLLCCEIHPIMTFQKRLAKIIRNGHYDAIHAHSWLFSGVLLKVGHKCRVPVRIAHCHTTRSKATSLYRNFYGWYMRHLIDRHATHRLGCSSEAMAALFGKHWQSLGNCRVLYCSIDVDEYRPGQVCRVKKSDFCYPPDALVVGHIGEFRVAKNHVFFLDIAAELIKLEPKAHFFFAGAGELQPEIQAKAVRLGLKNRVVFAGVRDDVPQLLMNLLDVLLFPSVYEGMPLTLVEAAAAGLRTVCSDVITVEATDVLPEAFTRLSLDLGPKQWAVKVLESLSKKRVPHEYAYAKVKASHFSADYSLAELERIYLSASNTAGIS